jgi:hypothetical protein
LYVSERLGPSFFPPHIYSVTFVEDISRLAKDIATIKEFFSKCAYIASVLKEHPKYRVPAFPDTIETIRPTTQPLSFEEKKRMDNYKSDEGGVADMRRS